MSPTTSARAASALFVAQAIFAVVHRLAGCQYRGFTHGFGIVVDSGLAAIWMAAAIAGLVRRSGLAFSMMCVGAVASYIQGHLFSVVTSSVGPHGVGVPFLIAAVVETYWMVQAVPAFRNVADEPWQAARAGSPAARHARSMV